MSIQGRLWNMLSDLNSKLNIYESCVTPQLRELEDFYSDTYKKFADTLNNNQQEVFWQIIDIFTDVSAKREEVATAVGFNLAKELYTFLSCPNKALFDSSDDKSTVMETYVEEMQMLDDYFNNKSK